MVDIIAHHPPIGGEPYLQEHGERQLDAQYHLRIKQALEGIANEEDDEQSQAQRETDTHNGMCILGIILLAKHAREDTTRSHTTGDGT